MLAADPLEQHLGRSGLGEPAGELLAVSASISDGTPYLFIAAVNASATARSDGIASTAAGDDEAGVVVDAGQDLALSLVGEVDPADKVELPQRHRRLALPALVLALVPLGLGHDQAVAL